MKRMTDRQIERAEDLWTVEDLIYILADEDKVTVKSLIKGLQSQGVNMSILVERLSEDDPQLSFEA